MDRDTFDGQDYHLSKIEEQQETQKTHTEVVHLLKWLLNKLSMYSTCMCA